MAVSAIPRMTARVLRSGLPGLVALLVGIALFEFVQPLVIASFGGAQDRQPAPTPGRPAASAAPVP